MGTVRNFSTPSPETRNSSWSAAPSFVMEGISFPSHLTFSWWRRLRYRLIVLALIDNSPALVPSSFVNGNSMCAAWRSLLLVRSRVAAIYVEINFFCDCARRDCFDGDDITSYSSDEADAIEDSTNACLFCAAWLPSLFLRWCIRVSFFNQARSIPTFFPACPASSELQGGPPQSWSWTMCRDVLHWTHFSGNQRNWLGFSRLTLLSGILISSMCWSMVGIFALDYWCWTLSAVCRTENAKWRGFCFA